MSGDSGVAALVGQLRVALADLQAEVTALRATVVSLEERLSLVESRTPTEEFEILPTEATSTAASVVTKAGYTVGSARQAIAGEIGAWVKRALRGQRQGLSGRERIIQSSRYYLVFKDFDSVIYNPPRVYSTWADCKAVVTRHRQSGDSIYLGLPTQEEARIVCSAAGVRVPAALSDGRSGRSQ